jgi:hypothetical protein
MLNHQRALIGALSILSPATGAQPGDTALSRIPGVSDFVLSRGV